MSEEKHQTEASAEQATDGSFVKHEVIKEDGRILIFYTFPHPVANDKRGGESPNV